MEIYHTPVFPLIISELQLPAFSSVKSSLIEWIYKYKETTGGVVVSNRGGWQSPSDFWQEESFKEFYDYMNIGFYGLSEAYPKYNFSISNMWINVNNKGDYNVSHCHPQSEMSGCLYIKVPENSGGIKFYCPDEFQRSRLLRAANPEFAEKFQYCANYTYTQPSEGMMLFFPPYLYHEVESNQSNEDRITIAFNFS